MSCSVHSVQPWVASVLKITVAFSCCLVSFCEKPGSWYVVTTHPHPHLGPPPWTPTVAGRIGVKRWRRPLCVCYAARHNSRRRWEGCCPIQTGAQSFSVIYQVTALHSGDLLCKHPIYFSKTAVSGRNHSGWLWEKYKMKNFATALCDAYQSEAKVSGKLSPFLPWHRRRKVTASLSLLFHVKAPGHSSTRPHQTLQPPCLHILLGDTERKIQSSTDCCFTFPPLFKYHWRHGWNKTHWGSQIGEGGKRCGTVYLAMLFELFTSGSRFEGCYQCAVCPWKLNSNKPRLLLTARL